jgi:hypothetical protein
VKRKSISFHQVETFLQADTAEIKLFLEIGLALEKGEFDDRPELKARLQEKLAVEMRLRKTAEEIIEDRSELETAYRKLANKSEKN